MITPSKQLRWGVLSTARILRRFVPALRTCPRSQLHAIASRDLQRGRAAAERWGIPRVHGSYDELLQDPDIDAVYVAAPNHLHAALSLRCAAAGKHVLCEKPLALSLREVDELRAAAERHRVVITEAFVHLHHPQARRLREELAQGVIGALGLLRGGHGFRLSDPGNIRWDPALGGGALWDLGCYPVSAFVYLLGRAPQQVLATCERATSEVDQTFSGLLRFAGLEPGQPAVVAHFDCSMVTPLPALLELSGTRGAVRLHTAFQADLDGWPNGFTVQRSDASEPLVTTFPPTDPFACEIQALEAAVLDGQPPLLPLAFSRQVTATLVALHEAAEQGRAVAVAA